MKFIVQIVAILLVNKLSSHGKPIVQNVNSTAENEIQSSAGRSLKFAGETSVSETLPAFNFQKNELNKEKNVFLETSSKTERLPKTFPPVNLTLTDASRLVLKNNLNLKYQQTEIKDLKNISNQLEIEEKATAKPSLDILLKSHSKEEESDNHVASQSEEETHISDTSRQLTTQKSNKISIQKQSTELQSSILISAQMRNVPNKREEKRDFADTALRRNITTINYLPSFEPTTNFLSKENHMPSKAFPEQAETKADNKNKYEISLLSSNLTKSFLVSKTDTDKQKDKADSQFWSIDRAKNLNEYTIGTIIPNSNGNSQSYNGTESELIEIVLTETTNVNKAPEKNNLSPELATNKTNSVLNEEVNLITKRYENHSTLLKPSATNSNNEPGPTLPTNFEGAQNYSANELVKNPLKEDTHFSQRQEEKAVSFTVPNSNNELSSITFEGAQNYIAAESKLVRKPLEEVKNVSQTQKETNVSSIEGVNTTLNASDNYQGLQILNATQNELDIAFEGINDVTKAQEKTQKEKSFKFKTTLTDIDELTHNTSDSLNRSQTFNKPENKQSTVNLQQVPNLHQIYLVSTKLLNKVNVSAPATTELNQKSLDAFIRNLNANVTENKLDKNKNPEDCHLNSSESLVKPNTTFFVTKDFQPSEGLQNFMKIESELKEVSLKQDVYVNKVQNEDDFSPGKVEDTVLSKNPLDNVNGIHDSSTVKDDALNEKALEKVSTLAAKEWTKNVLIGNEEHQNFNKNDKDVKNAKTSSEKVIDLNSVESLAELATSFSSNIEQTTLAWHKFEETKNYTATEIIAARFEDQQLSEKKQYPAESSSFSLEEEEEESTSKSKTSLEEYAVKQMNFILDHLLLETQKFVAKVLQATINSVFPRDRLKHYAESVNQLLNPVMESDYSAEILENIKTESQDDIYEQIVKKLDFLRNKSSKYLQKQVPPEWLNEFQDKRAELAIWLDKAAEQMRKEFAVYITEEDPIKYQYFNETFADISRATEIHHKLAFLTDLVKIIINKKQITFMDLYMQT